MALTREDLQAMKILLEENLKPVHERLERMEEGQKRFEERLKSFEERQKKFEERQKKFEERQERFEERLKKFEERQKSFEEKQKRFEERQERFEERLERVESTLKVIQGDLEKVKEKTTEICLTLENQTNRDIRIVAENHLNLADKLEGVLLVAERTRFQGLEISDLRRRMVRVEERLANLEKEGA